MIEPRTPEWFQARLGRVTGSVVSQVMGSQTMYDNLLGQLVSEVLTGEIKTFTAKITNAGIEREADAIALYEFEHEMVIPSTVITEGEYLACTPDGFVGEDGIIEVKSPWQPINHIQCWWKGMPPKHKPQIQFNLWITQRKWCDFISYSPDVPVPKRLFVERIEWDDKYISRMVAKVDLFLEDLKNALEVMAA